MQAAGIDEAALMPGVRCLSAQSLNEGFAKFVSNGWEFGRRCGGQFTVCINKRNLSRTDSVCTACNKLKCTGNSHFAQAGKTCSFNRVASRSSRCCLWETA